MTNVVIASPAPVLLICAYKHGPWTAASSETLTYGRFVTNSNSADHVNGGDGVLDR
jgi:hypothetical protein